MKDNSLKGMSLPQLTELLNFTNSYADFLQRTNQTNMGQPVNFSDLKISDQNRDAVSSEAEASAKAYAESRNRNSQPKNLTGLDQDLVKSVRDWANNRKSHLRGKE